MKMTRAERVQTNQKKQNEQNRNQQNLASNTNVADNSNTNQSQTFEQSNYQQENFNLSALGGHKPTPVEGPEKIALRSMELGYFIPALVGKLPLTFLVDTGSNVSILRRDLLDSWPQDQLTDVSPVNIQLVTATGEYSPFYGKAAIAWPRNIAPLPKGHGPHVERKVSFF